MPYKSPLETRLAKKVTKAITEHSLIEDGDRVIEPVEHFELVTKLPSPE